MANKLSFIDRIKETYALRDPESVSTIIGGSALALHLANIGITVPEETVKDVDTMGSVEAIEYIERVARVDRAPVSRLSRFSVTGPTLNLTVFPNSEQAQLGILPFSAASLIRDKNHTMSPEILQEQKLIEYIGNSKIPVISFVEMLRWMAKVGRPKDIGRINDLLPVAETNGLIDSTNAREIEDFVMQATTRPQPDARPRGNYPVDPEINYPV